MNLTPRTELESAWRTLRIAGIDLSWLEFLHGFAAAPNAMALPQWINASVASGLSQGNFTREPSAVFSMKSGNICAELSSGCDAHLRIQLPLTVGNVEALRPLTAALAQQWLLVGALAMHAAVLEISGTSILVLGNSQAGKSTLVRCAMQIGAKVVSDDFVLLKIGPDAQITATSLRGFLRFRNAANADTLLRITPTDPRFSAELHIEALLFLQPGVRMERSQIAPLSVLEASAQLINQSAPLFLRREFPMERVKLLAWIQKLTKLPMRQMIGGFELIERPEAEFPRILAELFASQQTSARVLP